MSRQPVRDEGLIALRELTAAPVEGLPEALGPAAWGALLGKPSLVVELPAPDPEEWLGFGHALPTTYRGGRLRQLALAVVVRPKTQSFTNVGELIGAPAAGFARVVLMTDARPDVSLGAWAQADWCNSTFEAAELLGTVHGLAGRPSARRTFREVVVLTDRHDAIEGDPRDDLDTAALLFGYRLRVFLPDAYLRRALPHVRSSTPHALIVADTDVTRSAPVIHAYNSATDARRIGSFRPTSNTALLVGLRSRLATAAGITAGLIVGHGAELTGTVDLEQEPSQPHRPRMPVVKEGRRLYHNRFGVFIECQESSYFYTIDNARHASVCKRYRKTATHLEWDADLDGDGNVLPKHKSQVGLHVPLNECSGA